MTLHITQRITDIREAGADHGDQVTPGASGDGGPQLHQGRGPALMDGGAEAGLPVLLEAGGRRARGRAAGGRHAGPGPQGGPAAGQSGGGGLVLIKTV